jgi:transposase
MLKHDIRTAVLEMASAGNSHRAIAKALKISRGTVARVIASGQQDAPLQQRAEKAEPYRDQIIELLSLCKGNLVRVHEELRAAGAAISYQGLTAFCRRHEIGTKPPVPVGSYEFEPGSEMQHDTSPHRVQIGGKMRAVQTASLVLCHCRMLFFQFYPRFRRFECKVFLTEAIRYMQGAARVCMIDNTHVVVLSGTGSNMRAVPEMEAFAQRLGFQFRAHRVGDPNRKGRVERPFSYIENNFLTGRDFSDWDHANAQAKDWCGRVNQTFKRYLKARPIDLYAQERAHLQPLPLHFSDPVEILHRIVDSERYVWVEGNRYSVSPKLIGRTVEVHQSYKQILIYHAGRLAATHNRLLDPLNERVLLPEHRFERGASTRSQERRVEEESLLKIVPEIADYIQELKNHGRSSALILRQLLRMAREYPRESFLRALSLALQYRLFDMQRLESLILRHIAADYFQLSNEKGDGNDES